MQSNTQPLDKLIGKYMHLVRHSEDRGHTKTDWLDSRHSFSFGSYRDPNWENFRSLRVINDDHVAPQSGFAPHNHKNMEILTYMVSGELTHEDSEKHRETLKKGHVQLMSAGRGIRHSEANTHKKEACHFLQVWLVPESMETGPRYQRLQVSPNQMENNLKLIASPTGEGDSLKILQDAYIYCSQVSAGHSITVSMERQRHVWVQIVSGSCTINGQTASLGDGVAISDEVQLEISAPDSPVELLLFDLN